jgi:hypothetical protein
MNHGRCTLVISLGMIPLGAGCDAGSSAPAVAADSEEDAAARTAAEAGRPDARPDAGPCADAGAGEAFYQCMLIAARPCIEAFGDDAGCLTSTELPCEIDCRGDGACRGVSCPNQEGEYCAAYDDLFLCRNGTFEQVYDERTWIDTVVFDFDQNAPVDALPDAHADAGRPDALPDAGPCADAGAGEPFYQCMLRAARGCITAEGDDAACLMSAEHPCEIDCRGDGACRGVSCPNQEGEYCAAYDDLFLCRNGTFEQVYDERTWLDTPTFDFDRNLPADAGPSAP